MALWLHLISTVISGGRGVSFVLCDVFKYQERSTVLLFGLHVSGTLLSLSLLFSSAQLSRVILPLTDSVQSQQLCFEKALFMSGWDHVLIHLSSAHWLATPARPAPPPPSLSFSVSFCLLLPLLFSPPGLCNQCGEMAPGELRGYSGNVRRCSSCGGTVFISP